MLETNDSFIQKYQNVSRNNVTQGATNINGTKSEFHDSVHMALIIVEACVILPSIIGNTLILLNLFKFRSLRSAIGALIDS